MKTGRAWDYWAVFFMRCFAFCLPNELTLILGLRGWQFRFVTFVSCLLFEKSIKWKCMSQKIEYYRRYRLIISFSTGLKKKCFDQTRSKCAKLWRNRSRFFKIYLILSANYRFFHVLIQKKRQGRPPPPPHPQTSDWRFSWNKSICATSLIMETQWRRHVFASTLKQFKSTWCRYLTFCAFADCSRFFLWV